MALRARRNIDVIIDRLGTQRFRFHENDDEETPTVPFAAPSAEAENQVRWLEERFGVIPMTLSSWIRLVGDVWLVGTHPHWPNSAAADPLVLETEGTRYPASNYRDHLEGEFAAWREAPHGAPFSLPVAPDYLHKSNTSGGAPYGVLLPDACADAHLTINGGMGMVPYLRWVFEWGGFPRPTGDREQWTVIHQLTRGERFTRVLQDI